MVENEKKSFWFFDNSKPRLILVADLGLFDVIICDGPEDMLNHVKQHLQDKITVPLKAVTNDKIRGIMPEWSGVPSGFTVVTGGQYAPEIPEC